MGTTKYNDSEWAPPHVLIERAEAIKNELAIIDKQLGINKATPSTGKQKYYFAVYQDHRPRKYTGILGSAMLTDLGELKKIVESDCSRFNIQYLEFEYEIIK